MVTTIPQSADERRTVLHALRRRGIAVPLSAFRQVDRDTPSQDVLAWSWSAATWDRPRAYDWKYSDAELRRAQGAWDRSDAHVQIQTTALGEIERRKADEQARRDAEAAAREQVCLYSITAELRRGYLAGPGRTVANFQRAMPELLERRAQESALRESNDVPVLPRSLLFG